jgi:hypothetical protein
MEVMRFSISKPCLSLVSLLLLLGGWRQLVQAQDNAVLRWDEAALQAVRNTRTGPPIAARAFAITHTCIYDAWAAYDPVAVGTRLSGALRRPVVEHTQANKQEAISFAAYRALLDLFPTQQALFDGLMKSLGYDPANSTTDTSTAAGAGNLAAAAVLAFRHSDGSNQLGDLNPGAYSDYTGYRPVNFPDRVIDPNRWQPLRLPNGQVQRFLTPHWGNVIPFALQSGSDVRPEKAPAFFEFMFFGWPYRRQALELLNISANLGDREKTIAEYWSDGPGTETPPGHWLLFGKFISRRDNHGLDEDAKMFFALANAGFDAGVAVWATKRLYDYVRPITAIRFLFRGQRVRAWGGPGIGAQLIFGEDWQPYQEPDFVTPPFAEYVSGHSGFSAASAEILKSFTGSDDFGASATLAAGSSKIEPGITPSTDITLSWATFSEAAMEAGMSRLFGGIHFMDGNLQGQKMGRKVGALVWQKAQTYFNGTAAN